MFKKAADKAVMYAFCCGTAFEKPGGLLILNKKIIKKTSVIRILDKFDEPHESFEH